MVDDAREDRVITTFLQSLGPWSRRVVIGGGYAPIVYKMYLSDQRSGNPPVGTRDIDSLVPRRIPPTAEKSIAEHLQEAGFLQFHKDIDHPATEVYAKEIEGVAVEVEFLTDQETRGDKNKNVVISGVVAQPLNYLNLSLRNPREFKTYSGQVGLVVSPGAWMLQKGLIFPRRNNELKLCKDLYGIWYVGSQMGSFSKEAMAEFHNLAAQHPKLFKRVVRNMCEWQEKATPAHWSRLADQDPFSVLTRHRFERMAQLLTDSQN